MFRNYYRAWTVLLVLSALSVQIESARKDHKQTASGRNKSRPQLLEENVKPKRPRQNHCRFGNQTYELEDRWLPDLGPPFGVLYCVRCECVPMPRKKRIVARTRCENIKNICPKPTCESPVLLPQRCCKTCPGQDNAAIEDDLAMRKLELEDEERNQKEYTVLLTGRGLIPTTPVSGAARGYLTAFKRHAHYTIHFSGLERPKWVRFKNEEGSIIEEHEIANPPGHVNESKVCGVWRKVPKTYRKHFPKERLSMELASEKYPDGYVGGKILPIPETRINKEVFSSLLIPGSPTSKETLGGGGIAIIYTELNSIYLDLEFNGIFLLTDSRNVPVYVQLMNTTDEGQPIAVESTVVHMAKVHPEYNSLSAKMDLDQSAQMLLYAGKLSLRLSAKDNAMFLHGRITVKVTCNVFQATMTLENQGGESLTPAKSPQAVSFNGDAPYLPASTSMTSNPWSNSRSPVGTAVVSLRSDGSLAYSIESVDLPDQPVLITLDAEEPTKKETRTLMTSNEIFLTDNKVTGLFPKSTKNVQEVEMLLSGDLFISMSTPRGPTWPRLSGRIRQRLYSDAFVNGAPLTLVSENIRTPSAVGQAWLSVDKDCGLHYAVYVAGLPIVDLMTSQARRSDLDEKSRERHLLELREEPPSHIDSPQQRVLQRLTTDDAEDVQEDVEPVTLDRMKHGFVYLAVSLRAAREKTVELKTKIVNVPIPVTCLSRHMSGIPDSNSLDPGDATNHIAIDNSDNNPHSCVDNGHVFSDGSQWVSSRSNCVMCSCLRGRVVCDDMICPTPPCANPETYEGECCKICPGEYPVNRSNATSTNGKYLGCYFEGDKKFHLAGTRWHPYIPPTGFSSCAICTCDATSLVVQCKRITCPQLTCAEREASRPEKACCKQCPNAVSVKSSVIVSPSANGGFFGDAGGPMTNLKETILSNGGCTFRGIVYENGASWYPTLQPYGLEKCVTCHCKDTRYRCRRVKCPKVGCPSADGPGNECCPKCQKRSEPRNPGNQKPPRRRKTRDRRNQIKKD